MHPGLRFALFAALVLAGPGSPRAGALEDGVKSRWLGAWVVLGVESHSLCNGAATDNVVRGDLVHSKGSIRFEPGELGRVERVDVKKSRIALSIEFAEPVLIDYADGPFTLYREAACAVDLEVELPREALRDKDVAAVEHAITGVVERHATRAAAESSTRWNGRRLEPLPEGYERTVAEHARWQAEQHNLAVRAGIALATEQSAAIAERIRSDPPYLDGFARGIQDVRKISAWGCPAMMAVAYGRPAPWPRASDETAAQAATADGYRDGRDLLLGLAVLRGLPACLVNPAAPASELASAVP